MREGETFIMILLLLLLLTSVDSQGLPGCPTKCGGVRIPYPFGFRDGCSRDANFLLTCNSTHYDPPKPFWQEHEVLEVSIERGEIIASFPISRGCYDKHATMLTPTYLTTNLSGSPFTYSDRNMFTVTGCATTAYMSNTTSGVFLAACASACSNSTKLISTRCYGGIGCCQASVPKGLKYYQLGFETYYGKTGVADYNPCSFAFLTQQNSFVLNDSMLTAHENYTMKPPVVLDWSMENVTCAQARSRTDYACLSRNSTCLPSPNGLGYLCNCSGGYGGNPYLESGCMDIDECKDPETYPCLGTCINWPGGYNCSCPEGTESEDPKRYSCRKESKSEVIAGVIAGTCGLVGLLLLLGGSGLFYKRSKRRAAKKLREKHFRQNHSLLLEVNKSHEDDAQRARFFSLEEMEKATNSFDETRIIGRGGHGTVYKGLLSDRRVVAIKKSNANEQTVIKTEIQQFINEVAILSRIDHRNVVRLLGCCLETEVPLLVYEFISNGTLSEHLDVWKRASPLSWDDRLRISSEVAGAISYLHSAASRSIFHRDLKSSNILLDDKLTAKVSDFGASKSIMADQAHVSTVIQGTYGYLDPQYYQTGQLTEKSDVYSMGVILVEMLTGEKPVSQARSEQMRNLTTYFTWALKENQLIQVTEASIVEEATREELEVVASVAESCLRLNGEERPTMKEVVVVLDGLRTPKMKQNAEKSLKTGKSLLPEISATYSGVSTTEESIVDGKFMATQNILR